MGVQVVSKLPKGCIWAPNRDSEMREPGAILAPSRDASRVSAELTSADLFQPGTGAHGMLPSPALPTILTSLNSPCMPLFLIIKTPGNIALPNTAKPQRQQLIFFKDV